MRRGLSPVVAVMLTCTITCSHAATDIDPRLKTFAAQKRQQTEELAARLHLDVPTELRDFFKVAEAGDCAAVSNAYERIQRITGQLASSITMPGYTNVLDVPVHETRGAYEFCDWEPGLLERYANGILGSIPPGSVYFGGTDPGRFVITMFHDTAKSPDIVVLTQKFVITQNALVDWRYTEYLRLTQGDRLWLPSTNDIQNAFQECASDMQERQRRGEQFGPDEQLDSSNHVHGVAAVMNINGIVTRRIFDHNKDKHPFFVEESYVIPWMYPYMEPHGLILKLNSEETDQLDPASIERDRAFWASLSKELLADPRFLRSDGARKTYSKLRTAIGGLYAYRKMSEEAEAAYKQAIELCPTSPEANFRLAQLYMELGRADDAIGVLVQLQKLDPLNDKIGMAIEQLRKVKQQAPEKQAK